MVMVALTDAGVAGKDVAAVFGLSAEYVWIQRGRARAQGSAGLVRRRGRPPRLNARQVARVRGWAGEGITQTEIAARLSVSRPVISELLARFGPAPRQPALTDPETDPGPDPEAGAADPATVLEETAPETAPEDIDQDVVPADEDVVPAAAAAPADPMVAAALVVSLVAEPVDRDAAVGARPGSRRGYAPAATPG